MTTSVAELSESARALSNAEKAVLIEDLAQLNLPDPAIEQIWADEVSRRIAAAKAGQLESFSYEEVMGKYL